LKILITGGAGNIGRELVRRALEAGNEVTVLDIPALEAGNEVTVLDIPQANYEGLKAKKALRL